MPVRKLAWSSWNYLDYEVGSKKTADSNSSTESNSGPTTPIPSAQESKVSLTYWMNLLQSIDATKFGDIFVTLNPSVPPRRDTVFAEFDYTHPVYTVEVTF